MNVYQQTLASISRTMVEGPIRYAGPENWTVFAKPVKSSDLGETVVLLPSTQGTDKCLVIYADLWQTFQELSLWIEALCIHEWCLFTEKVQQESGAASDRGDIYRLLTDRPSNRRALTWERNNVEMLLAAGVEFVCPWTEKRIRAGVDYNMDHLIPVSVYPINELTEPSTCRSTLQFPHQKRQTTIARKIAASKTPSRVGIRPLWIIESII